MSTIFDSAAPVKSDRRFGILPRRERRMPYTWQDLQDAAQMFGDAEAERLLAEENRLLEEQAQEAAWNDQFTNSFPEAGHCHLCGEKCDDLTFQGLCDRCDNVATDATIAGQNERAGLGYQVF